jgi:predicted metal-binding membrane protein
MPAGTPPESAPDATGLTGRDRPGVLTSVVLLVLAAAAWARMLLVPMAADDMAGMGMVMTPTVVDGLAYVTAWTIMMAAMMLPSAMPMIGLYAATQRNASPGVRVVAVALFTSTYLGLWALTGVPIYLGSVALGALGQNALAYGISGLLVIAGLFQISPLKRMCLRHCRSPLGFLFGHWRSGWRGGVEMGWAHALYCLGCCWALMVVLVVAGAMGLPWVLLIAAVVAAEKLLPRGEWVAYLTGAALILLGVAVAVRPDLAIALRSAGGSK